MAHRMGWAVTGCAAAAATLRGVAQDCRGQIAIVFAIAGVMLVAALGAAIDLGRGYLVGQQLAAVATLSCQYANRPMVVQLTYGNAATAPATFNSQVTSFVNAALARENVPYTQTNATPFSFTANGPAAVSLTVSMPTSFIKVVGITTVPVSATVQCFATPPNALQVTPDATAATVLTEGFENTAKAGGVVLYRPSGAATMLGVPLSPTALTSQVGYVGTTGTEWLITGYCLEIDPAGRNELTVPEGSNAGELDCDNGQGTAGNSSISTKAYLQAKTYELRYYYAGRLQNDDYDPAYICGSAAADLSWADSANYGSTNTESAKTGQVNVYLDQNTTGSPPTHTTLDGTQTLAGSNLIDACVYSGGWIERSVMITVTTPGYYWLSFAADGANDSIGGDLDDIQLCVTACTGTVQDNFPTAWANNLVLFADTFESPTYVSQGQGYNNEGDMTLSLGTSGASSGWPGQTASGWALAPYNRLPYWLSGKGCPQGNQCVELGWVVNGSNTQISRPFLLVPGYYQISYDYISEVTFTNLSTVYCGATPAAAHIASLTALSSEGTIRPLGTATGTQQTEDTNTVAVFMSHFQEASDPNFAAFETSTVYTNPDGSTSATPTVPPAGISLTSYNAAQFNPLLYICGYAATAQARSATVKILKPAYYWLTFAGLGEIDAFGGWVDNVKLTALGSPAMASPPNSYITIPVPNPQVHTTLSFTGFSIEAEAQNE